MNCGQSELWMMDALDGALAPLDRQRLMAHLELCSLCRTEWNALHALEGMLAASPMLSPAPGFPDKVEARIARFETQRRTFVGGMILLGAAAALCLLAVPSLLNGRDPIEAYGAFLGTVYDLFTHGALLSFKLLSALWLTLDTLAKSMDVSLLNLLTYAAGTVLLLAAWRRTLTSQRVSAGAERNGH
jgi:predicted anti-sigma-YlaC factor YlaD